MKRGTTVHVVVSRVNVPDDQSYAECRGVYLTRESAEAERARAQEAMRLWHAEDEGAEVSVAVWEQVVQP